MKVSTRGGVLTLTLLVAHTKCLLLALHKEGGKPLACTGSGAFLAFASTSGTFRGGVLRVGRGIALALEAFAIASQVGTIAFAILAVPPGLLKLKKVFRNLGPRRQKRAEICSDLSNLMKRIIKLPSMNIIHCGTACNM